MSLAIRLLPVLLACGLILGRPAGADTTTTTSTMVTTTTSTSTTVETTTSTTTTLVTTTTTSTSVTTTTSTSSTTTSSTSTSSSTTTSTSTTSTTSTSIQVCQCDDLPFFAEFTAKLAPDTTVRNDLAVNESNGIAVLAAGAVMDPGTTLTADHVRISTGASVWDVRTNDLQAPPSSIGGTVGSAALPLRAPFCPLVPAPTCGTGDLLVSGTSTVLPAGSYGKITVGVGATLNLPDNGTYRFCELRIANGGTVLATHQITIEVVGNVLVGTDSGLRTGGRSPLRLRVGGTKVLLGRDALVTAAIVAPNAKAKVKKNSRLEGCLCAETIKVAKQGSLECTGDSPSGAFVD